MLEPRTTHLTEKSVLEAIAGIAAEESGVLRGPIKRPLTSGADFLDALGQEWDVKTFISFAPNGRYVFNIGNCITSLQRDLSLGENIILSMIRLRTEDALSLTREIATRFSQEEIRRIIAVSRNGMFN